MRNVIWLANAPAGKWSSGPVIIDEEIVPGLLQRYRDMGWEITGPFVSLGTALETITATLEARWPSCGWADDDYLQGEDHGRELAWEDAIDTVKEIMADFETFEVARRYCNPSKEDNP